MTTDDLEAAIAERLAEAGIEDAARDARRIVEAARAQGGEGAAERAEAMASRRAAGAPLAYVLGRQRFLGVELLADPGALVPREETELLGRRAIAILREASSTGEGLVAIDMCCGSGNLACGIAAELPALRVFASDLTDGCVSLARRNVEHLGLRDRVTVVQGDLFAPLDGLGLEGTIDAIVCNPPYISTGRLAKDRAELLDHEPREAFDGGPYGLSIHQRVVKDALRYLRPGGHLMFEIGLGQEKQIQLLFDRTRAYEPVVFECDAEGRPRCALGRRKASDSGTTPS
ncbi:MAG: class I SAM-dependent methyltransferase [Polyangiales bacterium]